MQYRVRVNINQLGNGELSDTMYVSGLSYRSMYSEDEKDALVCPHIVAVAKLIVMVDKHDHPAVLTLEQYENEIGQWVMADECARDLVAS